MKTVLCLLADGFEDIEAVATIDLLRRANIDVTTCGLSRRRVTSSAGITLDADTVLDEVSTSFDLLFLPGGKGVQNLESDPRVLSLIKDFAKQDKWIAAICAAPSILGKLGLLDGESFTCYPSFEQFMPDGIHKNGPVVISNQFITGNGIGGVFDFSLTIIETLLDENIKNQVRTSTLIK